MKKTGKKFFSVIMAVLVVLTTTVSAFALTVNVSTINTDWTGSFDIYKYDITNAEKDGVWDPATSPPASVIPAWRMSSAAIRERAR